MKLHLSQILKEAQDHKQCRQWWWKSLLWARKSGSKAKMVMQGDKAIPFMAHWPEMGDIPLSAKESGKKPFSIFYNGRFTMIIGLLSPQWLSESRGQHLLRSYSIFREEMKWHTSFIGFWKVANCSLWSICLLKVPHKPAGVVIHPFWVTSYISVYRWSSYIFFLTSAHRVFIKLGDLEDMNIDEK